MPLHRSTNVDHPVITNLSNLDALSGSGYLINAFDPEHRILYWNETCEQFFGIKKEMAIGSILEELLPRVKGNEKLQNLARAFRGQKVHILRERYDSSNLHYEQKLIPLKDENGLVYAVVNIVRNFDFNPTKA